MPKEAPKSEKSQDPIEELSVKFKKSVIGQDEAIDTISRHVVSNQPDSEGGLKGVFLFMGPDGVGKIHTAKALAEATKPSGADTKQHFVDLNKARVPDSFKDGGVMYMSDIHEIDSGRLEFARGIADGTTHLLTRAAADKDSSTRNEKEDYIDLSKAYLVLSSEGGSGAMKRAHLGVEHPGFGHKQPPETSAQQNLRIGRAALEDPDKHSLFADISDNQHADERQQRKRSLSDIVRSSKVRPVGFGYLTEEDKAKIASQKIREQTRGRVVPSDKLISKAVSEGTSSTNGVHLLDQTVQRLVATDYHANIATGKIKPEERVVGKVDTKGQVSFGKHSEAKSNSGI